jgi:hypothetical protein
MTRLFRLEARSRFLRAVIAPLVFFATLSGCAGGAEYRQRTVVSPPITAWVTHPVDLDQSGRYTTTSAQTATRVLPSAWGVETDWIQPREGAGGRSASLDTLHVLELAADGPLARVMSGALTDRSVVVAEASTGKLHFYDRTTGRMQRSVGRLGSGPGEFRRLDWLKARGAELYAYDAELRRLSVWTADGMLLRTVALAGETGATVPHPIDVFADGGILGASIVPENGVSADGVLRPRTASVVAPRYRLSRHLADGRQAVALATYRGNESFVAPNAGGGATSGRALFGRHGGAVASGEVVAILSSEGDSVLRFGTDGRRLGRLSVPLSASITVRRADVARARALSVPPGRLPFDIGAVFDQQTPPIHFPRFGWGGRVRLPVLTSTRDGTLWLLRYGGVRSTEALYLQFSLRGELVDSLRLRDEARVLDARDNLVLVATTDDDGVERVLLLRRRLR